MVHIIYWNGYDYSLTSSVLNPDTEVLKSKKLANILKDKGVILILGRAVLRGKVEVPTIFNKQVSGRLVDLIDLVPRNEELYIVRKSGKITYFKNDKSPEEVI